MQTNMRQAKERKKNIRKSYLFILLLVCAVAAAYVVVNIIDNQTSYHPPNISGPEAIPQNAQSNSSGNGKGYANENEWYLILVNKWNPIEANSNIEVIELSNGERVDERIYPYLQEMFDAARKDGIYPIVASGYRTEEEQTRIYNEKLSAYMADGLSYEEAKNETEFWVAVPGSSEHQFGLAVDINADGVHSTDYEVYDWLANNAHLYGFITRYPFGKTHLTGVENEPWHYRYVGINAATEIYNQGICLEEYLGKVN